MTVTQTNIVSLRPQAPYYVRCQACRIWREDHWTPAAALGAATEHAARMARCAVFVVRCDDTGAQEVTEIIRRPRAHVAM